MFEHAFANALDRLLDPIHLSNNRSIEEEARPTWCEKLAHHTGVQLYVRPSDPYADTVYRSAKSAFAFRCDGDFLAGILNDRDKPVNLTLWIEDDHDAPQCIQIVVPGRSFYKLPIVSFVLTHQSFTFQVQGEPQILCIPHMRFVFGVVNETVYQHVRKRPAFDIEGSAFRFSHRDGHLTVEQKDESA